MGATSVTGVGPGAGIPNKGPGNLRNQFVSLLDPHVVYHGHIYMDNNTVTIDLPSDVKDLPENLTILVAGKGYGVTKNLDGDGLVESFDVDGSKKRDIDFVVIKSVGGKFTDRDYNF